MFMLLKRSNLLFWHRNVLGSAELVQSHLGTGNLDVHLSRQGKLKEWTKKHQKYFLHKEFNKNTGKIKSVKN